MYERLYTTRSLTACWITIKRFLEEGEMARCAWRQLIRMERNKTNTIARLISEQMIWRHGLAAPIDAEGLTPVCSSTEKRRRAHFFLELFSAIIVRSKRSNPHRQLPLPSPRSPFMPRGQLFLWLRHPSSRLLRSSSAATHH